MDVRSWKVPIGRVLRRTSRKRRSMAFVVRTGFRSSGVGYRKRVRRSSGVVAQGFDGLRMGFPPAVGEAACGGARDGDVRGVHDVVEAAFRVLLVGPAEFVEDVPDLVGPAAPDGDVGMDQGQCGEEAVAAVDADHFGTLAGEAAPMEGGEQALPFGGALAPGEPEVDDLPAPVGEDAEGH